MEFPGFLPLVPADRVPAGWRLPTTHPVAEHGSLKRKDEE